jgi:hypothetical protein
LVGVRLLVGRALARRGAVGAENDVVDALTFLLAIKDRTERPRTVWAHQERRGLFSRRQPADIMARLPPPLLDLGLVYRLSRILLPPELRRGLARSSGCRCRHIGEACGGQAVAG